MRLSPFCQYSLECFWYIIFPYLNLFRSYSFRYSDYLMTCSCPLSLRKDKVSNCDCGWYFVSSETYNEIEHTDNMVLFQSQVFLCKVLVILGRLFLNQRSLYAYILSSHYYYLVIKCFTDFVSLIYNIVEYREALKYIKIINFEAQ